MKIGRNMRIAALLLALVMVATAMSVTAFASGSSELSTERADALAELNLFQGTDKGYELDATPTRIQGVVMLIRLLGLEDEALAHEENSPFTDLSWGKDYIAYAYENGLARGVSDTSFDPNSPLDAKSYVTLLLRALDYDDAAGDFSWNDALAFAASEGLMDSAAAETLAGVSLNRGDMVDLSYCALTMDVKDGSVTLAERLVSDGVFTRQAGVDAGVIGGGLVKYEYEASEPVEEEPEPEPSSSAVSYSYQNVAGVDAHILKVDVSDPSVTIKTAMVSNTLGATANFSDIVAQSGALAVFNGNFFASYDEFKVPIGHVMVDGELLYGNSGISSLGIYEDGSVQIGRPGIFTELKSDGNSWSIYEVNTDWQDSYASVLYTPAYGQSFPANVDGTVMVVSGGTITGYQSVSAGSSVSIPSNGYVAFMGRDYTSTDYYRTPSVGSSIELSYYIKEDNGESFSMDGIVGMVSGAPRLVKDGAIVTELEAGFQEERFTTAVSPRTAIGIDASGKLVIVSVPGGASIQQMRELMLALGCVDAFNLDGGASCAMYYDGQYIATPGRQLTVTLQIFA